MISYLAAYLGAAIVFLAIDFVWLTRIARQFYFEKIGDLLLERPNLGAAAAFYAVYVIGIVFFAVAPAIRSGSGLTAIGHGMLFGLLAYATYDMTNYATLKNWSLTVALVDMAWGAVLTGTAAFAGYHAARLVGSA